VNAGTRTVGRARPPRGGSVFFHNRARNQKRELLFPPDETRKNSPAIVGGKAQLDRKNLLSEQEECSVAHECLPIRLCVSNFSGSPEGKLTDAQKFIRTLTVKEDRDHSKQERNAAKLNHTAGTAQNTIAGELVA